MMVKKGDTVFYHLGGSLDDPTIVRAKALVVHKDGTAKVEAQFYRREGKDYGPFLGFTYDGVPIFPNEVAVEDYLWDLRRCFLPIGAGRRTKAVKARKTELERRVA